MKLRYVVLAGALALSALGLAACSSSVSCSDKGSCPNDVAPTQTQIDACNKAESGSCASQAKTFTQCAHDHSTCSDAGTSTVDLTTNCATEFAAYTTCCAGNDGGACL